MEGRNLSKNTENGAQAPFSAIKHRQIITISTHGSTRLYNNSIELFFRQLKKLQKNFY